MTIKEIRLKTEMSQSEFAEYCGISKRSLQEWEQERTQPPYYLTELLTRVINAESKIEKEWEMEEEISMTKGTYRVKYMVLKNKAFATMKKTTVQAESLGDIIRHIKEQETKKFYIVEIKKSIDIKKLFKGKGEKPEEEQVKNIGTPVDPIEEIKKTALWSKIEEILSEVSGNETKLVLEVNEDKEPATFDINQYVRVPKAVDPLGNAVEWSDWLYSKNITSKTTLKEVFGEAQYIKHMYESIPNMADDLCKKIAELDNI